MHARAEVEEALTLPHLYWTEHPELHAVPPPSGRTQRRPSAIAPVHEVADSEG
jgi:hypothetical protein